MSRFETLLQCLLDGTTADFVPQSRNEALLLQLCQQGMGGGGAESNIVVVGLDLEAMKLTHTLTEIQNLQNSGKLVLCDFTGARIMIMLTVADIPELASTFMLTAIEGSVTLLQIDFRTDGAVTGQHFHTLQTVS